MAEAIPHVDPDTWVTMQTIQSVRPWLKDDWFKDRRDRRLVPFTKIGGKSSTCLYRLRDIDVLIESAITPAETGPLAKTAVEA